jgi:hypothetical protein
MVNSLSLQTWRLRVSLLDREGCTIQFLASTPSNGYSLLLCWVEQMWPTVSRPIRLGVGHPFGVHDQIFLFPFFCRTIALIFILGRPLSREDGSVFCSAICQWSESWRTHNHALLSHLRLLGSLSVASYDSQGLWWKYSNPPPHGVGLLLKYWQAIFLQTVMTLSGHSNRPQIY